jgi:O-antigen ligase
MKRSAPVNKIAKDLSVLAAIILILMPFHAFITVWLSSLTGHYTLLRLWKEFLLVPIAIGAIYIIVVDPKLHRKLADLWITRLIVLYLLLLLVCGIGALAGHDVTAKAMWYGLLVDSRYLIFFLAVLILASRSDWLYRRWQKVLFIPAVLVGAFAILQFLILPYDFLKHFGYGSSTIPPYETINHNLHHIRVAAFLRGANPLGAYLIVPISALAFFILKDKRERRDKLMFGFGLLLALGFSFSRSAWLGAALGILVVAWFSLKSQRAKKTAGWVLAGALILGALITFVLKDNLSFENFVFHTDKVSTISTSSNEGHADAFKFAGQDIIHHPLGSGVGTAGPQSVYNNQPARIAENYYLQVGQEAGIIGMILFIAIICAAGLMLYEHRADPLALALLASLIAISFVNLLSHAWEDDTLAYLWWGFAGIALAPAILTDRLKRKNGKKNKTAA